MSEWRNCRPSSIRDHLITHTAVRLGRLNRFGPIRAARRAMIHILSRQGGRVKARIENDLELLVPTSDVSIMRALISGVLFDSSVGRALQKQLRSGDVFVDGGAHVGLFTLMAARRVGKTGRVVAFEPQPFNAELLRLNIKNSNCRAWVSAEEAALANFTGTADFFWSPSVTTHGRLLSQVAPDSSVTPVRVFELDRYLSGQRVDVIKLDLEGGEVRAIEGMRASLRRARCLIMEVNKPRIQEQDLEPTAVLDAAMRAGAFTSAYVLPLREIRPKHLSHLDDELSAFGWSNVILSRDATQ